MKSSRAIPFSLGAVMLAGLTAFSAAAFAAAMPQPYQGQWSPDCADDESLGLGLYAMEIGPETVRIGLDACLPARQQTTAKGLALDLKCESIEGDRYALSLLWRLEGADKLIEIDTSKPGQTNYYERCK